MLAFVVAVALVSAGAGFTQQEATSLLGKALVSPVPAPEVKARMEADLAAALEAQKKAPNDPDALIWVGRRTAYLGRFREAIAIFGDGIKRFPQDARFLRHRGHRYISVREFDRAIADLKKAATLVAGKPDQVEPDGQPNAKGVPLTTLHSNIRYHLALAHYLKHDFAKAAPVWQQARDSVNNPDNLVSASYWLYLSLRRLNRPDEAARVLERITPDLAVIENGSYHSLLLLFKGDRTAEDLLTKISGGPTGAAVLYGVGAWHLIHGRGPFAEKLFRGLVDGPEWAPFGVIAAEAELARMSKR